MVLNDRDKSLAVIQVRMSEVDESQNLALDQVQCADIASEGGVAINQFHSSIGKGDQNGLSDPGFKKIKPDAQKACRLGLHSSTPVAQD